MPNVGDTLGYAFATICRRIPIFLAEGDSFPTAWPRRPVPFAVAPRVRSFPPADRPPPSGQIGTAPDRGRGGSRIGNSRSLSADWTEIVLYKLKYFFSAAIARLHEERRYRVCADLERIVGRRDAALGIDQRMIRPFRLCNAILPQYDYAIQACHGLSNRSEIAVSQTAECRESQRNRTREPAVARRGRRRNARRPFSAPFGSLREQKGPMDMGWVG